VKVDKVFSFGLPTECSLFQHFATVQAISKLEEPDVILGDLINEMTRRAELAQGKLVMVLVVKDVHE
jgi:hypothetical protein